MAEVVELKATVTKTDSAVRLLQEKLCREHGLSQEEIQSATISIKGSEITVKPKKGKKDE
jgi:hypothetical protein